MFRRRWIFGLLALVLLGACSSAPDSIGRNSTSTSTDAPTADEEAANGPLAGDPSLIASEQSCVDGEANAPWYPTIAAFEVHDSDRTHLYECAHFGGAMSDTNQVFAYRSQQDYITPYNIVD